MTKLPIVCKHVCSYTYAKITKYRPLYVLLLEYNEEGKRYYTNFIKEDGRLYGRHYDRWVAWDDETKHANVNHFFTLLGKMFFTP